MIINVIDQSKQVARGSAKIVFCYENGELLENKDGLSEDMIAKIDYLIKSKQLVGKTGEACVLNLAREEKPDRLIVIGVGDKEKQDLDGLRKAVSKGIKEVKGQKVEMVDLSVVGMNTSLPAEEVVKVIAEIAILANYKFDKYLSEKENAEVKTVNILCEEDHLATYEKASTEGVILGEGTVIARNLVNEPSNKMLPIQLAEEAKRFGEISGFEVEVFDEKQIHDLGMVAYLEVAKASANPPRLIVMRYKGDPDNKEELVGLIGKGLTYDSGGLSIKPTASMLTMKSDMGGSAAVIGAMSAIAKGQLKVNVTAIVAACENMIDGEGYRPGDIIQSMAGKTIHIGNTDAEGRLTLVDAVHYAIEKEKVTKIIDVATLTGSSASFFADVTTSVLSNDDDLYAKLEGASKQSGEKVWRLPIFDEYKEFVKSDIADLENASKKGAGMIQAGLFIGAFVQDKPWIHMDIAGTSWSDSDKSFISKGGTGVGARTLYYLMKNM